MSLQVPAWAYPCPSLRFMQWSVPISLDSPAEVERGAELGQRAQARRPAWGKGMMRTQSRLRVFTKASLIPLLSEDRTDVKQGQSPRGERSCGVLRSIAVAVVDEVLDQMGGTIGFEPPFDGGKRHGADIQSGDDRLC